MRVSHNVPTNEALFSFPFVRQSGDIHVELHSYECHQVLVSRQRAVRCSHVFSRLSYDICTSVAKISHCKFAKISRLQVRDTRTNVIRLSHDSRVIVLQILAKKIA